MACSRRKFVVVVFGRKVWIMRLPLADQHTNDTLIDKNYSKFKPDHQVIYVKAFSSCILTTNDPCMVLTPRGGFVWNYS